ncbi:MAG: hypothetical protein ACE5JQ_08175 [Candidatus Methylomirabilales bacterium]
MSRNGGLLKIVAAAIWAASIAAVGLSFYSAQVTGYEYTPLASFRTYNGILTASVLALAMVILAGILTMHRVGNASRRLVKSMAETLEPSGLPLKVVEIQAAVDRELKRAPNSAKAQRLDEALEEYHGLRKFRRDIKTLLAAPVGLLSAIFAISAWALPATEVFLQSFVYLNTALLFFVTYGMVIAIAAAIVAVLAMLSSGEAVA